MEKKIQLDYQEYSSENELSETYKKLVLASKKATENAYADYSNFKVGAAVLLDNDKVITGNNQENAAFPSGLCAERVAMFYANANYPENSVEAIAIVAKSTNGFLPYPAAPCGACRQVLLETEDRYNKPITVILYGSKKIIVIPNVKFLLPFFFDKSAMD
ncbi:cytidine deaminase [Balneicella halophila]|uniref:Cytidine deaminase n=1 Tax=Balneicella halophila TaxID=1537566 RepID=A0A7L4UQJ8_BALHA|nr:cytidine deaminase [Balneicella halophila]PVX52046.1 cytidine deaminase [Balneicella halophila]